jgi:hypothetical protein
LKPAATNTFVSITTPSTRPPQVQFYCGNLPPQIARRARRRKRGVPGFTMAARVASSARVHRDHLRRGTEGSNPAPSSGESTNFWFLKLLNPNGDDCLVATNRSARFRSAGCANELLLPTREAWKFYGLGRDARLAALANVGMENRVRTSISQDGVLP